MDGTALPAMEQEKERNRVVEDSQCTIPILFIHLMLLNTEVVQVNKKNNQFSKPVSTF